MNIYDRIIPVPQKFTCHPGEDVPLGSPGRANFHYLWTPAPATRSSSLPTFL